MILVENYLLRKTIQNGLNQYLNNINFKYQEENKCCTIANLILPSEK